MESQDLLDIMGDMSRQIKDGDGEGFYVSDKTPKPRNIHEALVLTDPVYASLYKQYCEAHAELNHLQAIYEEDDPMREVAQDRCDSALSALQTRRIECQADTSLREEVMSMVSTSHEDHRLENSSKNRRRYRHDQRQLKMRDQKHQKALDDAVQGFFWTMWVLMLLDHTLNATVRNFKLAQAFSMASQNEPQRMRARA